MHQIVLSFLLNRLILFPSAMGSGAGPTFFCVMASVIYLCLLWPVLWWGWRRVAARKILADEADQKKIFRSSLKAWGSFYVALISAYAVQLGLFGGYMGAMKLSGIYEVRSTINDASILIVASACVLGLVTTCFIATSNRPAKSVLKRYVGKSPDVSRPE